MKSYILYRYATLLAKHAEPIPIREVAEIILGVLYMGNKTFAEICDYVNTFERSAILKGCFSLMDLGLIERDDVCINGHHTHMYKITRAGVLFEEHMNERVQHYLKLFASQFKKES